MYGQDVQKYYFLLKSMPLIKKILQVVVPLALAAILFWLVYRNMDFGKLADVLKRGLHYDWLFVAVALSALSNVLRGLRWRQLLEPVSDQSKNSTAILAVFVSYAVNLLFPRAGEVARCGIVAKNDGVSFSRSLGTVISERILDACCLLLIAIFAILLQLGFFADFFQQNPDSLNKLKDTITSPTLWGSLLLLVVVYFLIRRQVKKSRLYEKTKAFLVKMWEGMKTIGTLRRPLLFVGYSVLIWVVYFLMFYVGRYFFPFEVNLGVVPMLSAFVMGSLGVLAPVQGGIGAYHFMVIYALTFYGINEPEAAIFALVVHGVQTVQSLVFGFLAWGWISVRKRSKTLV
jgi:glycosyltransferase 2 family protein